MWSARLLKSRMSTQKTVRQSADSVEENKLRLEQEKAEQIVDALNTELANSYVLYHQLKKHHWVVEGAEFLPLHEFLEEAYEHVEEGADVIAERAQAQALGGVLFRDRRTRKTARPSSSRARTSTTSERCSRTTSRCTARSSSRCAAASNSPRTWATRDRRDPPRDPRHARGRRPPLRALPRGRHAGARGSDPLIRSAVTGIGTPATRRGCAGTD